MEERYNNGKNYTKDEHGRFTGSTGGGSGGGTKFSKKVDGKVRTAFNETLAEMEEKFGKITTISEVDILPESEAGTSYGVFDDHSGVLRLRYADKKNCLALHQQKALEMKKAGKWSSSHPLHVFRHEIGHAIQLEHFKNDKQWGNKLNKISEIFKNSDKSTVSIYATFDIDEFISESIAESMTSKARGTSKKLVSIIIGE